MKKFKRDSARWKQLDGLLDAVLELPAEQRSAFLDEACAGDKNLREEMDRLLSSADELGSFIERPALVSAKVNSSDLGSLFKGEPARDSLLRTGQLVASRYHILSHLGKGGMADVWHAYDLKLRIDVALKSLRWNPHQRPEEPVESIRREVLTARDVISPNVCRIFDLVSEEDKELISMEYIDGITLLEMMEQKGPLHLREARDIAAQFLAGLQAIHDAGLVHRDLKPENIMITRTGRVVVMDLGIAEQIAHAGSAISGTLPYMSPEQLAGEKIDGRSDIFSAGVVLAEVIHAKGTQSKTTRETIWKAVRENAMQLPDSPWKAVIARAVAENRDDRFESAAVLSRALEEITLRSEADEAQRPYPGLASFQHKDSDYFFGREQEVETLIKKLRQHYLMALIGPSGAGKTSFLQAGLIPALPKEWGCVIMHPGDAPLRNLKQSLTADSGFEEAGEVIRVLSRLRQEHAEFVLIVDRFEELFTLNSFAVQLQFAEVLGDAAREANIRILLAMRDDFLIFCKEHEPLSSIFSELTAMLPLGGAALRRALVQPALKCGYKFEDETLVDEILRDLEKERGALPLLAFAASLLWEKRDRQTGQLKRDAYKQIGGVQGALAQHAETMMAQLGTDKEPVVREIFRNLITAQDTRVARDTEELLSVFGDQQDAEDVLRILIDARLLTSFEASGSQDKNSKRRVEINHESLITNWPRLVKWQMQEAEDAQLRDQLRQAAQLWAERGRSLDLLWSGAAFLEFQLWRQRYPGGLTKNEEAFAQAMTLHANRKRKRRQFTIAAIVVVLLITLAVVGNFWRKASVARDDAVLQAKRAAAGGVLTVGRAIPDADPTTKLAYALASLELADTPQGHRFALQALAEGPAAHILDIGRHTTLELSPDGQWIATGRFDGSVDILPQDGSRIIRVQQPFRPGHYVQWNSQFSPNGNLLIWTWREDPSVVKVWSLSEKKLVRTFKLEGLTMCMVRGNTAFLITDTTGRKETPFYWSQSVIRTWRFDEKEPEVLGRINLEKDSNNFDIDARGRRIAYIKDSRIFVRSLDGSEIGSEQLIGSHELEVESLKFHPNGDQIASSDSSEIGLWSLIPGSKNPVRTISAAARFMWFDPKGSFLFVSQDTGLARWDLTNENVQPLLFRSPDNPVALIFDKQERWIATGAGATLSFFPKEPNYPYTFRVKNDSHFRFTPDGKSVVSGADRIYLWNMRGEKQFPARQLWSSKVWNATSIDIDASGKHLIATTLGDGVHLIPIDTAKDLRLQGISPDESYSSVSFSPDGKSVAAAATKGIEIWDLRSGKSRIVEQSKETHFPSLKYAPDGILISGDSTGKLYRWNLKDDSFTILRKAKGLWVTGIAVSNDGKHLAAVTSSAKGVFDLPGATSELVLFNVRAGRTIPISSHGNRVFSVAFDPSGTRLITGDLDGIVRVGPITGDTPHLLLGQGNIVDNVVVHPSGQWIASVEAGSVVRLWRMPRGKPLNSLPYNEFLTHLRAQTNVRAVPENDSPSGYRIQYQSFAGWKTLAKRAKVVPSDDYQK